MTVREALAEGGRLLKKPTPRASIDTPALDAALLLGEVLGLDRPGLIAAGPDPLPEDKEQAYRRFLDRRLQGECTAYILGRREFWGLDFALSPAVLVPRPDTETLVEAALEWLGNGGHSVEGAASSVNAGNPAAPETSPPHSPSPILHSPLKVLDLCTGSGAVAIALKHERPDLEVWASDISGEALELARTNAKRLLAARLLAARLPRGEAGPPVRFVQSDLFAHISGVFDLILANPPYVPSGIIETLSPEVRGEPRLALDGGEDGLDLIRRIIREAAAHLRRGGRLFLEADPGQMEAIAGILREEAYGEIETRKDLSGRPRVIGAGRR